MEGEGEENQETTRTCSSNSDQTAWTSATAVAINAVFSLTVMALLMTAAAAANEYTNLQPHRWRRCPAGSSIPSPIPLLVNYTSWAANQTFNLGDYLIFRTNTNQTVIQTYNHITSTHPIRYLPVQLRQNSIRAMADDRVTVDQTGSNFFFSDAGDGVQCKHGLSFEIFVTHGLGLPPSLNRPPPPPYIKPPGPDAAGYDHRWFTFT